MQMHSVAEGADAPRPAAVRAPRSRLLLAVSAVAVAIALVGLAGGAGRRAREPSADAVRRVLDDGTTLDAWSAPVTASASDMDDDGVDSPLDAPRVASVAGQPVVAAAEYVFARINQDRYLCAQPAFTFYSVLSAQLQLLDGGVRFFLHLRVEGELLFDVQLEQLPTFAHTITTSTNREGQVPQILGDYRIERMQPTACVNSTAADVNWPDSEHVGPQVSSQASSSDPAAMRVAGAGLPAAMNSLAELSASTRALGYKPPRPEDMRAVMAQTTILSVGEGKMPKEYNAAERYSDCKAFVVKDQKSCGSCYAFAAAGALSARLCALSGGQYNVDISPQQIVSCNGKDGCGGGNALESYEQMYTAGRVSELCMPYQGKDVVGGGPTCMADMCDTGMEFLAEKNSLGVIADNVEAIQAELLLNGPVFAAFWVYPDFMQYTGGVYHVSDEAKKAGKTGAHAVMMIGWGTDEVTGEDYWLLQNSWSNKWGMDGLFKIRRGVDECNMESMGVWFATPKVPEACGAKLCANGAELDKDCKCRCSAGWTGDTCSVCTVQCGVGGKLDPRTCSCHCMPGYRGHLCENQVQLEGAVVCAESFGSDAWPKLKWNIAEEDAKFVPGGFIQVFDKNTDPWSETNGWAKPASNPIHICGEKDEWEAGSKCPASGELGVPQLAAGDYTVYYAKYLGSNEFGVSRGYAQPLQRIWPGITIVDSCDIVVETEGKVKQQMVHDARAALEAKWLADEDKAARREARVQEAEEASKLIKAPEPARLSVPGVAFGVVSIEYSLPQHLDTNPSSTKQFGLFPAGQRRTWYELGEVQGQREGVLNLDVDGIPPGDYDLGMVAVGRVQAAKELKVGTVALSYKFRYDSENLDIDVTWEVKPAAVARPTMWVGVFKEGAPLTEPIDFTLLKGNEGEAIPAGTSTFTVKASADPGPLGVKPGGSLTVRLVWGYDAVLSEGSLRWPEAEPVIQSDEQSAAESGKMQALGVHRLLRVHQTDLRAARGHLRSHLQSRELSSV